MKEFVIAGRQISPSHPPYVIAEMSGNHNGNIDRALRLIEAAHQAGANAVKLQTYTADTLTIDCDKPDFRINGGLWNGETLYSLYKKAHTPWEWHERLFAYGHQLGITVFSTPFDEAAVDFLEGLGNPAYKIASFECVDLELIARAARTGKPLIFSTGMASPEDIQLAIRTAGEAGVRGILPLHCVSAYPSRADDANLRMLPELASRTVGMAGLSDHTPGFAVPVAAVALGAVVIEKHLTLSRDEGGPDAAFSLEPEEFALMTAACRDSWLALGSVTHERPSCETPNLIFRRSLYVVADIPAGAIFDRSNTRSIRPGNGLSPRFLNDILGKRSRFALTRGTALSWDMVEH